MSQEIGMTDGVDKDQPSDDTSIEEAGSYSGEEAQELDNGYDSEGSESVKDPSVKDFE